tara:strand:- start:810 stop:1037 length:228 start_codon:yes stop_codon:yes gene_type:complete
MAPFSQILEPPQNPGRFTLDLIKAKLAVESLQSNLKDVALELSHGRSPTELSVLLSDYINLALAELSSASISTER